MRERWLAGGDAGCPASRQQERLASRPPRRPKLLQSSTFEDKVPRVYLLQEIAAPFRLHIRLHLRHTRSAGSLPPVALVAKQTSNRRLSHWYLRSLDDLPGTRHPHFPPPGPRIRKLTRIWYYCTGPRPLLHKTGIADGKPSERSNGSCDCIFCQHSGLLSLHSLQPDNRTDHEMISIFL